MTSENPPWGQPAVDYAPAAAGEPCTANRRFGKPWETVGQQSYGTKASGGNLRRYVRRVA